MWALRPGALEKGSLADAVARLGDDLRQSAAIRIAVDVVGERRRLATDVEVTLLRAAQELLSNVRQHATATQAGVTLTYAPDAILLKVHDDGVGIRSEPSDDRRRGERGLGLVMMRERVEALGGSLLIDSSPESGTTVLIRVPMRGEIAATAERGAPVVADGTAAAP